ncbi:helix-turn-helix domain-containing protein [Pisciglobus halotolerans]|uniref:helix-turn-helix domain-containing protein n=1 Tax=Pisciglobus halotolerans TaxID=745365 RepID=UPI0015A6E42C|nr:helix-turn-helix transcriptional regulator [Pisciglobus halotolerans]
MSLRAARENAGLSGEEAAKILGMHKQTLYKYENDSSDIPLRVLKELSKLYQMPVDNIFLGKRYDLIRTIKRKREEEAI